MKKFCRILALLLAVCMFSGISTSCKKSPETKSQVASESESSIVVSSEISEVSKVDNSIPVDNSTFDETKTPVLKVRINETYWRSVDLTEYLGKDNTWVNVPFEIGMLTTGFNQFAVHSNAYNNGNRMKKSVDVFYTLIAAGATDSFVSTDVMGSWEMMADRVANIKLELFNGKDWVELPEKIDYKMDESCVVGLFVPQDTVYNVCRNINIDKLEGYTQARISVNLHVGTSLLEEPVPEPEDEADVASPLDTTAPVLKVKLNGTVWKRYDLTPDKNKSDVWVTVPLEFSKLRAGDNKITVDSNVKNRSNFSDQSVDLYFTNAENPGDSEISTDKMTSWTEYPDRYANIYLELHNKATGKWVKVLPKETFNKFEHTVVGLFTAQDPETPYNMRRKIYIESLDGYDNVRAKLNLHVGKDLLFK